jgi:hypothetical protein
MFKEVKIFWEEYETRLYRIEVSFLEAFQNEDLNFLSKRLDDCLKEYGAVLVMKMLADVKQARSLKKAIFTDVMNQLLEKKLDNFVRSYENTDEYLINLFVSK